MGLDKAVIRRERTGESIPVLFNPEEYSVEAGNSFAEVPIPGSRVPPIQFVRGTARVLKMDLFFDTTAKGTDVRREAERVVGLLAPDQVTLGPPVLLFAWGSFQLRCVLERVSQRFARFLPNGLPVRAYLAVAFREYEAVALETRAGLFLG